jgi:hypothetical protein
MGAFGAPEYLPERLVSELLVGVRVAYVATGPEHVLIVGDGKVYSYGKGYLGHGRGPDGSDETILNAPLQIVEWYRPDGELAARTPHVVQIAAGGITNLAAEPDGLSNGIYYAWGQVNHPNADYDDTSNDESDQQHVYPLPRSRASALGIPGLHDNIHQPRMRGGWD